MQWRIQGLKLFKNKHYVSAIQCFEHSQDKDLKMRCQAFDFAETGSNLRGEADALMRLVNDKE